MEKSNKRSADLGIHQESAFEGTLVLEQLASIDKVDAFFDAVDSDDFDHAASLMKQARIDSKTMRIVLEKMRESDDSE